MLFWPPDLKRAQGDDVDPRQMFIESNALRALTTRTELLSDDTENENCAK